MNKKIPFYRQISIFFTLLLLIYVFPSFILMYSSYKNQSSAKDMFILKQSEALEYYEGMVRDEFNNIFSDLEYLYLSPLFQDYLKSGKNIGQLAESWKVYSKSKRNL